MNHGDIMKWFNDDDILLTREIENVQISEEEKRAHTEYVNYTAEMKNTNEWVDMDGTVEGHIYILLLDELEMHKDMCSYEEEEMCHNLFAYEHFDLRGHGARPAHSGHCSQLSKRSEMDVEGQVTKIGCDYGTMETIYGKVFLPKNILQGEDIGHYCDSVEENEYITVKAQFKGFSSTRLTAMAWRALYVKCDEGVDEWSSQPINYYILKIGRRRLSILPKVPLDRRTPHTPRHEYKAVVYTYKW